MANFRAVNKAVRAQLGPSAPEVIRGVGYFYYADDAAESVMAHPTSTSTEDVIRMALADLRPVTARNLAKQWREEAGPAYVGGFMVIYRGDVAGWVKDITLKPSSWLAGCLAVDPDGELWRAEGGTDYDGADAWVKL